MASLTGFSSGHSSMPFKDVEREAGNTPLACPMKPARGCSRTFCHSISCQLMSHEQTHRHEQSAGGWLLLGDPRP